MDKRGKEDEDRQQATDEARTGESLATIQFAMLSQPSFRGEEHPCGEQDKRDGRN